MKESSWASFDGNVQSEVVTVQKTSVLADVQAAVEKQFGLGREIYKLFIYNMNPFLRWRKLPVVVEIIQ